MLADKNNLPSAKSENRFPYKVFVSGTYLDNEEKRRLVKEATITRAGIVWHGIVLIGHLFMA